MKRLLTNTAVAVATVAIMLIGENIEVQHYSTPSEIVADGNPMPPPPKSQWMLADGNPVPPPPAKSQWMLADGNPMPPPPNSRLLIADGNPMPPPPAESKQPLTV